MGHFHCFGTHIFHCSTGSHCIPLYSTVALYSTVFHCITIFHCSTVSHCSTVFHCIPLSHCIALYRTVFHCSTVYNILYSIVSISYNIITDFHRFVSHFFWHHNSSHIYCFATHLFYGISYWTVIGFYCMHYWTVIGFHCIHHRITQYHWIHRIPLYAPPYNTVSLDTSDSTVCTTV